jgi:hypothetical protein
MDVSKYAKAKANNAVEMKRYGDSFQCIKRQFDPETGKETSPAISTFTEAELVKQQEAATKLLDSVNEMLADLRALK